MSDLSILTLGDLIEFQRGYDLPKSEFKKGNIPVISSNGVLGYHNESKVKAPGITIGRSGTVGLPHFIEKDFFPHNTSLFIKDFKNNDIKYIFYLLKNLKLNDKKSGSGVPTMNRNHLHPLKIKAYSKKNEQQKISNVLSSLDSKIELNNKINKELESMAKTLYDYWFVQFDFPDVNGKPYKSSGGKMVYNQELKREVPDGWEVDSLWNIATYFNGLAMQKHRPINDNKLKVIKIKEMNEGFGDYTEYAKNDVQKEAIINNGDILFSWSASLDVIIWSKGTGALNQHIFKVSSKKYPRSFYYYELINYLKHFKMMANLRKTTMGHITQEHLKQSKIVIPSMNLIRTLDSKINVFIEKQILLQQQNQELAKLRDWLLPMLMNGQVKVK